MSRMHEPEGDDEENQESKGPATVAKKGRCRPASSTPTAAQLLGAVATKMRSEHMQNKVSAYMTALKEASKRRPDLERAYAGLTVAHGQGDVRATYALATWYLHGRHVRRNLRKAIALLRHAAKRGYTEALFDLAVSYEKGIGIRRNERKAAECYLRCALSGGADAQYEVGRCYYYGIGFERDRRVGGIWLDVAAKEKRIHRKSV